MSGFLTNGWADLWQLLVLTVLLGGAAAWVTGKAIAKTWKPYWQLVWYVLLLAAALRFLHYALFQSILLDAFAYAADALYLIVIAALGHSQARRRQMREQYGWLAADHPASAPPPSALSHDRHQTGT